LTGLNDYLDFPHVGQAFAIHRERVEKKTGESTSETAYGITSLKTARLRTPVFFHPNFCSQTPTYWHCSPNFHPLFHSLLSTTTP